MSIVPTGLLLLSPPLLLDAVKGSGLEVPWNCCGWLVPVAEGTSKDLLARRMG
jgi:hypothetical protein